MKIFKKNKYSILKTISKYSFIFILFTSLIVPVVFVKADDAATTTVKVNSGIVNPLSGGPQDIQSFIQAILKIVLYIGIPIVALAIIYSGFLFVQAQGNPSEIEKAKRTFMYTLIGAALLLGAVVISSAIKGTVDQITTS